MSFTIQDLYEMNNFDYAKALETNDPTATPLVEAVAIDKIASSDNALKIEMKRFNATLDKPYYDRLRQLRFEEIDNWRK